MNDISETPGIRFQTDGHVARMTLARPSRHNALEATDVEAARSFLDAVEADPNLRVLVVTGEGDATFCSGASLAQMRSGEMSGALFDTLTDRLAACRVPTVGRLNGSVYGGGAELALCCDFRIGVTGMRLSVPAARLGVAYPIGGLSRYVRRLGLTAATRILLAAEEVESEELVRIGYLTQSVERDRLDAVVDGRVLHLASLAPLAVQTMKRIMRGIVDGDLDRSDAEARVARVIESDDLREGLEAWHEGRPPHFDGR